MKIDLIKFEHLYNQVNSMNESNFILREYQD